VTKEIDGSMLTLDEAKDLIDDLAEMGVPLLMFTGGEPLLRKGFWEIVHYASLKGLRTALSSNGTLITKVVTRKIKEAGIEYVGISLDGAKAETHDLIRGVQGSFQKSIVALKNCIEDGLKCGIRVTATKDNYHEIPDLLDLALQLSVPRFCLYWLVPSGRGKAIYGSKSLEDHEVKWVLEVLYKRACELDPEKIEILTVDAPQDGIYVLNRLKEEKPHEFENALRLLQSTSGSCSAGDRIANIDPYGNIYVCQFAQLPELRVGNIRQRNFSELWNDNANPILSLFRNKTKNLVGKCGKCSYKQLCGGGCRIRAYFHYKNLWFDDPLCSLAIRREPDYDSRAGFGVA
jgi:radical SAM protein with 4Fe4S-binding SPASM domain